MAGAISRTRGRILFDREEFDIRSVYSIRPDGSGLICLTKNGRGNGDSVWSPDGGEIGNSQLSELLDVRRG